MEIDSVDCMYLSVSTNLHGLRLNMCAQAVHNKIRSVTSRETMETMLVRAISVKN
jgi:hypothetical protein